MSRRAAAVLAALLLVLVGVPIAALISAGSRPPVATRSSPPPSPAASHQNPIVFTAPSSPEDAAWFRIGADPRQFPARLQVGTTSDGVTFEADITRLGLAVGPVVPQRLVAGIADGVVVAVDDDGRRSSIRAVVAATGEAHHVLESDDLIIDALTGAREVFFVTADRQTGDLTGAWRIPIAPDAIPRPIDGLVGAVPKARLIAVSQFLTRLMISPDASTLGLLHCIELDCRVRAVRAASGEAVTALEMRRGGPDIFAITESSLLALPGCPDGPECALPESIDLATGERTPLPLERWQFYSEALVDTDAGPVLVVQTAGEGAPPVPGPVEPPAITVIDVTELREVGSLAPDLAFMRILRSTDNGIGVELPRGWILARGSRDAEPGLGAFAIRLADGSVVPLAALGEIFVQG